MGSNRYIQLSSFTLSSGSHCRRVRMQRRCLAILGIFVCATVLIGSIASSTGSIEKDEIEIFGSVPPVKNATHLIVIGDTGGIPLFHTTRSQGKTATSMSKLSRERGLDAIINLGDNVYYTGVDNEFDGRFESSFETPYNFAALEVPWHMIAGNHDHFGNISAQVAYTKYSRKWSFPSLYYSFSTTAPDGATSDFIMIDSIVLCGNSRDIEYAGFWKMFISKSHEPQGPVNKTLAEEQWNWIEEQMKSSRADYLFVGGHYPIHSASSHGPTKCMQDRLDPLLHKYNVTAYLAGHDHTLQHISYPRSSGGRMDYFVSGAGSRADPSRKHDYTITPPGIKHHHYPKSGTIISQLGVGDGGFMFVSISKKDAVIEFLDENAHQVYKTSLKSRS